MTEPSIILSNELENLLDPYSGESSENSRAAVALIFSNEHSPQLLMIERSQNENDPWAGQMAFPGGRLELNDENLKSTADRETLEEIGLDLKDSAELLGTLTPVRARRAGSQLDFSIIPFIYWLKREINIERVLKPSPLEVAAIKWVSINHLLDPKNHFNFAYNSNTAIQLPAIRLDENKIWGLSYLMLTDFVKRLERSAWINHWQKQNNLINLDFWKTYPL